MSLKLQCLGSWKIVKVVNNIQGEDTWSICDNPIDDIPYGISTFMVTDVVQRLRHVTVQRQPYETIRCEKQGFERLKAKAEVSARLGYTSLLGGLEHLKIETRLIDERFASVMGECVTLK
jgi:hypothetical protein